MYYFLRSPFRHKAYKKGCNVVETRISTFKKKTAKERAKGW